MTLCSAPSGGRRTRLGCERSIDTRRGNRPPVAAREVRSWASVFALVALGMLALETIAAVVVSR